MLHAGLPALGEGGRQGPLLPGYGEDPGSPQGEDNHPEDGASSSSQLVQTARKAREALKIPLSGTRYFTDSSAELGMLRTESGKFLEFVGARVSEVKVNSDVEKPTLLKKLLNNLTFYLALELCSSNKLEF